VELTDQFGTADAKVIRVEQFCTPVYKNGEGTPDPTKDLTCYSITERGFEARQLDVENQLGNLTLRLGRPSLLCVPPGQPVD
jgi:hypothetical protein